MFHKFSERDDVTLHQHLNVMVVNLIKNFGRPRGAVTIAKSYTKTAACQLEPQEEVAYLCDQIMVECDRIQKLQNAFGYLPSKTLLDR